MPDISKKIDDRVIKWLGIPVVGILAMRFSGFGHAASPDDLIFFADPAYFILISTILWHGNVLVHYSLRMWLYKISKLYFRIPIRYGITIVFRGWFPSFCCSPGTPCCTTDPIQLANCFTLSSLWW